MDDGRERCCVRGRLRVRLGACLALRRHVRARHTHDELSDAGSDATTADVLAPTPTQARRRRRRCVQSTGDEPTLHSPARRHEVDAPRGRDHRRDVGPTHFERLRERRRGLVDGARHVRALRHDGDFRIDDNDSDGTIADGSRSPGSQERVPGSVRPATASASSRSRGSRSPSTRSPIRRSIFPRHHRSIPGLPWDEWALADRDIKLAGFTGVEHLLRRFVWGGRPLPSGSTARPCSTRSPSRITRPFAVIGSFTAATGGVAAFHRIAGVIHRSQRGLPIGPAPR